MFTVILETKKKKKKCLSLFPFFPIYLSLNGRRGYNDLSFLNIEFEAFFFHSPLSPSSKTSLVSLCFLPKEWCQLHIWSYLYFCQQSWFQLMLHPARHLHDILWYIIYQMIYLLLHLIFCLFGSTLFSSWIAWLKIYEFYLFKKNQSWFHQSFLFFWYWFSLFLLWLLLFPSLCWLSALSFS